MISPHISIVSDDNNVRVHLDALPAALHRELRTTITSITQRLLAQVKAGEPVRTGYMRGRTHAFVDETPTMVRGRVRIIATGRAQRTAAAFGALEYGAHRSFTVRAYTRAGVRVSPYIRRANIAEQRFLRGPIGIMRPRIVAEIHAAIARAVQ